VSPSTLITGGYGFIGSPLCVELVSRGHSVAVLDNGRRGGPQNLPLAVRQEVRDFQGDVRNCDELQAALAAFQPDAVIHLAAIHFIPDCEANPAEAISINVGGTQAVFQAAYLSDVRNVVFASSAAVYSPGLGPHREDNRLAPTDIYGLTKLWTEHLGALHHQRTGARVIGARLFNVYGPGETNPHIIPEIVRQASKSDVMALGNLATRRDYVYVADVARALAEMVAPGGPDEFLVCNVGTGYERDGYDLVDGIGEVLGQHLRIEVDPARVRASDRPSLLSDSSLATSRFGWRPEVPFVQGLAEAARRPWAPSSVR
jgi:UDP-glucose 4-epimerase